jgi:hypothetical protein
MKPPLYAEIFGTYDEDKNGQPILVVQTIDGVQEGKTCHLMDLMGMPGK